MRLFYFFNIIFGLSSYPVQNQSISFILVKQHFPLKRHPVIGFTKTINC